MISYSLLTVWFIQVKLTMISYSLLTVWSLRFHCILRSYVYLLYQKFAFVENWRLLQRLCGK